MRHFCDIAYNDISLNVLADSKCQLALGVSVLITVDKLAQRDHFSVYVRHLDTDARLARHRRDTHACCSKVECDVIGKSGYLVYSYACCGFKLISCYRWAVENADYP